MTQSIACPPALTKRAADTAGDMSAKALKVGGAVASEAGKAAVRAGKQAAKAGDRLAK